MNYTNEIIVEHVDLPDLFLIIFGLFIIICLLSQIFPGFFTKICQSKNKVSTTNIKYDNTDYHYTEIYFDTLNKKCPICTEDLLKGEEIYITDCKHYYHKKCIIKWFQNSYNCPLCRNFVYDIYDVNLI